MKHHAVFNELSLAAVTDPIPTRGVGVANLAGVLAELRRGRPWERRGAEPGQLPAAPGNPCALVLTFAPPGRRRVRVRCHCMAEYRSKINYYNYDHLADVDTLAAARATWDAHRASVAHRTSGAAV